MVVIARSTASPSRFCRAEKISSAGVTAFLVEKRGRNSYSARVNGRFQVLNGIPRQLTVGNLVRS